MSDAEKESSAWSLFITAHVVLVESVERQLAAAKLPSLDWYDALWALERSPGQRLRMSEFEQWMVISRSNITRLIDRLEDAGLVKRERADDDRRSAFALLTSDGRALRRRMWTVYGKAIDMLFDSRLTAEERRVAARIFHKLLAPPAAK